MKENEVRTKLSKGQEDAEQDAFGARRRASTSEHKRIRKKVSKIRS